MDIKKWEEMNQLIIESMNICRTWGDLKVAQILNQTYDVFLLERIEKRMIKIESRKTELRKELNYFK